MKGKGLLAAFLLGVGLCFAPATGRGEIRAWLEESLVSSMESDFKRNFPEEPLQTVFKYTRMGHPTRLDFQLLQSQILYIMACPNGFLAVQLCYDPDGKLGKDIGLPEGIDTKGKIVASIVDTRDIFSYKSGIALLDQFKRELESLYGWGLVKTIATDMDNDIVAKFYSREVIPLGYFYQGKYHLWEK